MVKGCVLKPIYLRKCRYTKHPAQIYMTSKRFFFALQNPRSVHVSYTAPCQIDIIGVDMVSLLLTLNILYNTLHIDLVFLMLTLKK